MEVSDAVRSREMEKKETRTEAVLFSRPSPMDSER